MGYNFTGLDKKDSLRINGIIIHTSLSYAYLNDLRERGYDEGEIGEAKKTLEETKDMLEKPRDTKSACRDLRGPDRRQMAECISDCLNELEKDLNKDVEMSPGKILEPYENGIEYTENLDKKELEEDDLKELDAVLRDLDEVRGYLRATEKVARD